MIQFLKSYWHKDTKFVVGSKSTLTPELEEELIKKGIARRAKWTGKIIKMKTNFFKPKN
jgi:hypothetical protein